MARPVSFDERGNAWRVRAYLLVAALVAAGWGAGRVTSPGLRWLLLGAVLAAAFVAVSRFVRATTVPLTRLAQAARALARGDLGRAVPSGEGATRELSSALSEIRDRMRRRAEELEAEERDLRTVLNGLPDAVFLLDEGGVTLANAAAGRMFREPAAGWSGIAMASVLPASLSAALDRARALGASGAVTEECGPDPSGRCLRATLLPLDAEAGRSLVLVSDVTERATLDSVRRDFVANASHELKTPTAAIQLLAESASDALPTAIRPKRSRSSPGSPTRPRACDVSCSTCSTSRDCKAVLWHPAR